jgi:hypothetical protein
LFGNNSATGPQLGGYSINKIMWS